MLYMLLNYYYYCYIFAAITTAIGHFYHHELELPKREKEFCSLDALLVA